MNSAKEVKGSVRRMHDKVWTQEEEFQVIGDRDKKRARRIEEIEVSLSSQESS